MNDLEKRIEKLEQRFSQTSPYTELDHTQKKLRDLQFNVVGWGITLFLSFVVFVNTSNVFEIFKTANNSGDVPSIQLVKISLFILLLGMTRLIYVFVLAPKPQKIRRIKVIVLGLTGLILCAIIYLFRQPIGQSVIYASFTNGANKLFGNYFLGLDSLVQTSMLCAITFTALYWWIRIARNIQKYIRLTIPNMDDDNPTILSEVSLERCLCGIFHAITFFMWASILW